MVTSAIGYPDDQRTAHTAGQTGQDTVQTIAIGTTFVAPVFYTGDFGYLNVSADTSRLAGHYFITIDWLINATDVQATIEDSFTVPPGGFNAWQVPVLTPYARIGIKNLDDASGIAITVFALGSNAPAPRIRTTNGGEPFISGSASILATSSQDFIANTMQFGAAVASVWHAANTTWSASLEYFDQASLAWKEFAWFNFDHTLHQVVQQIALPPQPVKAHLNNDDTAARQMQVSIVLV